MKYLALFCCGLFAGVPLGCKDTDPCDPGQEIKATGCFPIRGGSSNGGSAIVDEGGAAGDAGGAGSGSMVEPWGNADATWGSPCTRNADCGPDAPICATEPLNYCSQIDCQEGEANFGVCPQGWDCFKYLEFPAICFNPDAK